MMDWEIALNKFLDEWKDKEEIRAILLSGSYAIGRQNKRSDIDVHLITSNKNEWRERGNLTVNGFLVEYFINPIKQHYSYMKEDFQSNSYTNARMFVIGKIIMDKDNCLSDLISSSREIMNKEFPRPSKVEIETWKYSIWDNLDNLLDSSRTLEDNFIHSYHLLLREILEKYCRYQGIEIPPPSRTVEYFRDNEFRNEYRYRDFPDKKFSELFLNCLHDQSLENITLLSNHTVSSMGGFNIDGWKIRTDLSEQ